MPGATSRMPLWWLMKHSDDAIANLLAVGDGKDTEVEASGALKELVEDLQRRQIFIGTSHDALFLDALYRFSSFSCFFCSPFFERLHGRGGRACVPSF
eukprot:COSAG05_NODE_147_length_16383_cov_266.102555_9_plen_98_part_00